MNHKEGLKLQIQPIIIKSSDNVGLPENLRSRYFLNYNCLEIDWLQNDFIVQNTSEGLFLLETDNETNPMDDGANSIMSESADTSDDNTLWDAPRIYFMLSKAVADSDFLITNFITTVIANEDVIWTGNEDLTPGEDYFINETLYRYLSANYHDGNNNDTDIQLYNYLLADGSVNTTWWEILDDTEKDYTNLEYYGLKNDSIKAEFTEEEIANFYSTFCQTILDNTHITEETCATNINQIYDTVLKYFAAFKSDETLQTLKLILGTSYKIAPDGYTSCNCSSSNGITSGTIMVSCSTQYDNALTEYLKTMLGDGQFYCDWMTEDEGQLASTGLITLLQTLILMFLERNYDMTFKKKSKFSCSCITDSDENEANRKIMENYLKVLDWVKNLQIEQNANKIKVYGEAFGELLPKLQF